MARPSCYNRPDFLNSLMVPNGYHSGLRLSTVIRHTMSTDCRQWGPAGEAKKRNWNCDGCRHKPTEIVCGICGGKVYENNMHCTDEGKEGCLRTQILKEIA